MRSRVNLSFGTMMMAPSLRISNGMAWRSRSLMTALESSRLRSVKRVVICGVVTRMMTNAKKPIRAAVTATIAINREAPKPFRKLTRPCKPTAPQIRSQTGSDHWAIIAYGMVSTSLTKVNGSDESSRTAKIGFAGRSRFSSNCDCRALTCHSRDRRHGDDGYVSLLAILLNSGRSQSGKAVLVERKLPGQAFGHGQRVTTARCLEGEQAAADRGNDFGLATDHPSLGS